MRRVALYLWALPATLVGLLAAAVAVAFGARARVRRGVVEVAGGCLAGALARRSGFLAITFGHVVLGQDHATLDRERAHEHAHVRQYERWGVLLPALYLAASVVEVLRGRHGYWHNRFEREARRAAASRTSPPLLPR
jgi:hypothetical protein